LVILQLMLFKESISEHVPMETMVEDLHSKKQTPMQEKERTLNLPVDNPDVSSTKDSLSLDLNKGPLRK